MGSKFHQGQFIPKNPDKYVGTYPIMSRSSWEMKCMLMFDEHPNIIAWASESIKIPYQNPFTGKHTVYIPDFIVKYKDANGSVITEIIEVKPAKEKFFEMAKSAKSKAAVTLNSYKWAAAQQFAVNKGWKFRVMTEYNIFNNPKRKG